ncbi:MAG: cell wall-binding repeat-containing protein [Acidimicrobiaceae bacterium]|nr:cell wall-binding repeat-containing protein [Acidimicrobiaceae bacterium]
MKRKKRRALAAITAALFAAAVLAAVGGPPVNAANTSGEELIDTDDDGIGDTREFAGSHRYNTAVALAERFADDQDNFSTVIIASGETQVDAVAAAGLAGHLRAPILLTRSGQLPHNVARFIEEHGIAKVVIVGGTAVIPTAIADAIKDLNTRPDVERLSGADRYATAAAISEAIDGPIASWCGSSQRAAIMVNGGDVGRSDSIIIGPLAYRLGMPILLTELRTLPGATRKFITDNKIQRVVIVGSDAAVSDRVRNSLVNDLNVVTARRIAGGTAAATSVALAHEMLNNCGTELGTNADMVALVNRDASADGIAAAPTLGRGLGNRGPVPILLVGSRLPSEVSDYLASTPETRSGRDTHMSILAIGGTAVVSRTVMNQAVAAARTAVGLTAKIRVDIDPLTGEYETHTTGGVTGGVFTVTFSDDVARPPASGIVRDTVLDPTMYRINGRRIAGVTFDGTTSDEPIMLVDEIYITDRTVTIRLSHILEPGDTISVLGGARVGAGGDLRRLERTSLTLPKLTPQLDRFAPTVDILAVAGMQTFRVFITEPNLIHNELTGVLWDDYIRVTGFGLRDISLSLTGTTPVAGSAEVTGSLGRHTATHAVDVTVSEPLAKGDAIVVERKAVIDERGVGNALRRLVVPDPKEPGKFEISAVFVGNQVNTINQAQATISTPAPSPVAKMRITARPTGAAAGANGNDWVIFGYDDRPGADAAEKAASTKAFNIVVFADATNKVINYLISESAPTRGIGRVANLLDLASALNRNSTFRTNFTVDYVRDDTGLKTNTNDAKDTALGPTDTAGVPLSGGVSAVGVLVRFNDTVQSLTETGGVYDIQTDLVRLGSTGYESELNFSAPTDEVFITYWASDPQALPHRTAFRIIMPGRATNYHNTEDTTLDSLEGTPSDRLSLSSFRPDARLKPQAKTPAQITALVGRLFP